ncbi:hypothetical protein [Paenibacillus sp. YIM B09110]|uniref:hypothetical protein n=1 Tax=Paenibacillus sp. YIM B09110 TaxID=3126102 RepID=UPI00301D0EF5
MGLFQMKPVQNGQHRMVSFLEDNYVCTGSEGLGDLECVSETELVARVTRQYGAEAAAISDNIEELGCFVFNMQDGDYVLVADGDDVHLGDLGDYYYVDRLDNEEDGSCHRRGVTWLTRYARADLREELHAFLADEAAVSRFEKPVTKTELENDWALKTLNKDRMSEEALPAAVPAYLIAEALAVLEAALHSDNADRRERAAIAILQYASKSSVMP